MSDFIPSALSPASVIWQGNTAHAPDYGDSYFMPGRGVEESEAVFLQANHLAARFSALPADGLFVIGETGFGTGLNALLSARCFARHAPPGAQLRFVSTELHPLSIADLAQAHCLWPELETWSRSLRAGWPEPVPGIHPIRLDERSELLLMLGDATTLWSFCSSRVDAWFLDGFAPDRNPSMWGPALFQALAERSRPGASLATFSAAGVVRRGLETTGFQVRREPGFGGKRHRLTASMTGTWRPQRLRRGRALVAGAGLAGASTARALAQRGWQVEVIAPATLPPPAPLAAVLYATVSHHLNAANRFYLHALLRARLWLQALGFPQDASDGRLAGMVQHLFNERLATRARRALEAAAWPAALLQADGPNRILLPAAGCLNVGRWLQTLLDHPAIHPHSTRVLDFDLGTGSGVRLRTENGQSLEADHLVLCTAGATTSLPGLDWLPLRISRGQVSLLQATSASADWQQVHSHEIYLTPALGGVHSLGATFDRSRRQPVADTKDDQTNLDNLARCLPQHYQALGGDQIQLAGQYAGLRCQSPDSLPLAGPLPQREGTGWSLSPRLWLNIAHGSRGLCHTPLCADLIADRLTGLPPALDSAMEYALAPERLVQRARRREQSWPAPD